ncbi:MAG TPA: Ig-like domain-containing protein, partial [Opitutaceae bacterium]
TASVTDNGGLTGVDSISLTVGANSSPAVNITAPADGATFAAGASVTFTATATDAQDGNLGASVTWSSDRDGALGTGASITRSTLSAGTHVIAASVTDQGGLSGVDSIQITIGANQSPAVSISAPANGSTFGAGTSVTFTATAADAEDGNLGASLAWSSDRDGSLGTGASITRSTLSAGAHVVTASATDSGGLTGSDTVDVTISGSSSTLPVTSGLVARFESTTGVTVASGMVTTWSDTSGQNNHLSAGGAPMLVSALTPSGLPAIRFDGLDDKLQRLHATAPLQGLPTANGNRTVFFVAKYNSLTAWAGLAYGTGSTNRAFGIVAKYPTGELVLHGWGSGQDLVSTRPAVGAGWLLQSATLASSVGTLYLDGTSVAQWSHTYNTVLTKLVIAEEINSKGFVNMEVAAVLIYNRALTNTERASVDGYLRTKFLAAP